MEVARPIPHFCCMSKSIILPWATLSFSFPSEKAHLDYSIGNIGPAANIAALRMLVHALRNKHRCGIDFVVFCVMKVKTFCRLRCWGSYLLPQDTCLLSQEERFHFKSWKIGWHVNIQPNANGFLFWSNYKGPRMVSLSFQAVIKIR